MDDKLESINRRLGQIEHLLNAVLEKQEKSTDNAMNALRFSVEGAEERLRRFFLSAFDSEEWLTDEQKARLLPYLVEVLEQERVWREARTSSTAERV